MPRSAQSSPTPICPADLPCPLPSIPGGWETREVAVGQRVLQLTLPANPDAFLDDPAVLAAHERTGYMPYWPYLWPAAISMAERVLHAPWPPGTPILEIGAGVGLVGLAALARGDHVTFNDYDPLAVDVAIHNAHRNGFSARGACFDWNDPPRDRYPVILGCEVVYDVANHPPLLRLLDRMLADGGLAWFGDPCRQHAERFLETAVSHGFAVELLDQPAATGKHTSAGRFQLIQLTRGAAGN